jgi:hypothetical protein
MVHALLPFKKPMTDDTACFGGIAIRDVNMVTHHNSFYDLALFLPKPTHGRFFQDVFVFAQTKLSFFVWVRTQHDICNAIWNGTDKCYVSLIYSSPS